jgi:hypothetical protein
VLVGNAATMQCCDEPFVPTQTSLLLLLLLLQVRAC